MLIQFTSCIDIQITFDRAADSKSWLSGRETSAISVPEKNRYTDTECKTSSQTY